MKPINFLTDLRTRSRIVVLLLLVITHAPQFLSAQTVKEENHERAMAEFIDGIIYFENGEIEKALDKLTAAYLMYSSDPGISYALSVAYLANGDLTNAAYYGQMSTRAEPGNKWYLLNMAEIYSRSGRQEMVLNQLKDVLNLDPGDLPILYVLTDAYLELGQLEEANEVLDRIIDISGSSFELHLRKFQNYNALLRDDLALAELEIMRELDPGNLLTLHRISRYYQELGKLDEAEEILLEARERNPNDLRTTLFLAELYLQQEKWDETGDLILRSIENSAVPPAEKIDLIRFLYMQHSHHPSAPGLTNYVDQAIGLIARTESEYAPAQLFTAEYYLNQNKMERALESLENAIALSPDNGEAWAQRFQILFSSQQYEQIIALSETAETSAPDNPFIRFFTGASYMLAEDYESAGHWLYQASLLSAPRDFRSVIYATLADVRVESGEWEEARSDYERALRLNRDNHNALNNYAYYITLHEEEEKRLSDALDMAKRALALEPENPSYLDTLAWIYFKTGNSAAAKEYIEQALDAGAQGAEVYEHMGDIQQSTGNHSEAIYWWRKALEEDPERSYLRELIEKR